MNTVGGGGPRRCWEAGWRKWSASARQGRVHAGERREMYRRM